MCIRMSVPSFYMHGIGFWDMGYKRSKYLTRAQRVSLPQGLDPKLAVGQLQKLVMLRTQCNCPRSDLVEYQQLITRLLEMLLAPGEQLSPTGVGLIVWHCLV